MKAVYQKPLTVTVAYNKEGFLLTATNPWDHADTKKGFFDEGEDDNLKSNDLWYNDKDNLWE